jgi:hypothetical protein
MSAGPGVVARVKSLIACRWGHNADPSLISSRTPPSVGRVEHRGDVRVIQSAVRELRQAFRCRPICRQAEGDDLRFRRLNATVGVPGGGRIGAPSGCASGHHRRRPGTRAGMRAGPRMSFGANIGLPWEQSANPVIGRTASWSRSVFPRKLTFIRHPDAVVLFPAALARWTGLRGVDVDADGEEPAHAVGAGGPARRRVLADMGPAPSRASTAQRADFARRPESLPDHGQPGAGGPVDRAVLSQLPFEPFRERSPGGPASARPERDRD